MIQEYLKNRLQKLKGLMVSLNFNKPYALVVIPYDGLGSRDLVSAFMLFLSKRHKEEFSGIVVNEMKPNFQSCLLEKGLNYCPKNLFLFSHTNAVLNGFSVNSSHAFPNPVILPEWWQGNDSNYQILIAHVCRGSQVLRRPPWKTIFPSWVSYNNEITCWLVSEIGRARWKSIFNELLLEVPKCRTPEAIKAKIQSIYLNAISKLYDS